MNSRQKFRVLQIRQLTESAYVLRVERQKFQFVPGQCVNIGLVNEAVNREYSTYSGIKDKYLEFLIKEVQGGLVSPALRRLTVGDFVSLDGAYGLFVIHKPEDRQKKYMFIGTGTGIAPFHAYVKSYPGLDYQIIHGIRQANEQYDRQNYDQGRYLACVSREAGGDFRGRVTDYLRLQQPKPELIYYLCGNSEMINEVYDILREANVSGSNIFTEVFF